MANDGNDVQLVALVERAHHQGYCLVVLPAVIETQRGKSEFVASLYRAADSSLHKEAVGGTPVAAAESVMRLLDGGS